jgi:hypothetical protein
VLDTAFERPATAVQHPVVPVWKTVTLGTRKGVESYRNALEQASIKIGDDAGEILGRPAFPYAHARIEHDLAVLSVAELAGDTKSVSLSDLYSRARSLGLELCPAEVGPQLRLDYRHQPHGETLNIAMPAVATYDGRLRILALSNFGGVVALIGSDGRPDFIWRDQVYLCAPLARSRSFWCARAFGAIASLADAIFENA